MERVGIRSLQQNAGEVVRRVRAGARIEITDRGRPVALLIPLPAKGIRERLLAEGRLVVRKGDLLELGPPLEVEPGAVSASERLRALRATER